MKIIQPTDFTTMPWKNGGGLTHEIIKRERQGKLLWRLSMAEVTSDGPFSVFPGLSRILTVIAGERLSLVGPHEMLQALPLQPVSFSGDLAIASQRRGGDVTDFNVIFDAAQVSANVRVMAQDTPITLRANEGDIHAVLVLAPALAGTRHVEARSLVLVESDVAEVICEGPAIHVMLTTP
jgi:environmental stress-induced protein Ves